MTAPTILVADADEAYPPQLAKALRGGGYDFVHTRSGSECLEWLALRSAACVLLHLALPGPDGDETCRRLKATPLVGDVPVIMLCDTPDPLAIIGAFNAGADDCLAKSDGFDILSARLRAQLRRRQAEQENRAMREQLLRNQLEATESRAIRILAETRAALVEELEQKNRELEAFNYSVSHDLRAPLRSIDGFSQALLEDCAHLLDDRGKSDLLQVRAASRRMGELIDDLRSLSSIGRSALVGQRVDLSAIAQEVVADLQRDAPQRTVRVSIEAGLLAYGDRGLLRIMLENLLGNAWKFTARTADAMIALASVADRGPFAYQVRDNGIGFDMAYATKLFSPFQRLHRSAEFPGSGIGLATVRRIVSRHGGKVWASAQPGHGAAFYWTLAAPKEAGLMLA